MVSDANGQCVFTSSPIHKRYSPVSLTVTSVMPPTADLHYQPAFNHDPDGESNGTSISVLKP
jgi:hypothetical protein